MPPRWFPATAQVLVVGLIVTIGFAVMMELLSLGRPRADDGWIVLRPTLLLYGLSVVSIPLAAILLVVGAKGIFGPAIHGFEPHPRILAFGAATMGLMFPYCAATSFCVRIRFNETGVEKSWFGRPTFVPWSEIRSVKRSFFQGPLIVDASGRGMQVSEYLVGFFDFLSMANEKGVQIADNFHK